MTTPVSMIVVGSIGIDDIETPFEQQANLLGGSVSYACAAASFFTDVGMVGIVGEDFDAAHSALYDHFGIDTQGLQRVPGKTFRWGGSYDADMINRQTLFTDLNVFETFSPDLPEAYCDCRFVLLGNISPELQLHVLSQCRSPRFVVADTMDLWINIARDTLLDVISRVNMLMLNDSEARLLVGEHNLLKCAEQMLQWGPEYVVIKKGEHGAILVSRDEVCLVPAFPLDAVRDPTGAGDVFAGAFLGALTAGGDVSAEAVRRALLRGSVVASFGVEDFSLAGLKAVDATSIDGRVTALQRMAAL